MTNQKHAQPGVASASRAVMSRRRFVWATRALVAINVVALTFSAAGVVLVMTSLARGGHAALLVALVMAVAMVAWSARDLLVELRLVRALRRSRRDIEA